MSITPDDKNWTWVLDRECPECGFESSRVRSDEIAPLVLANAELWRDLLEGDANELRQRRRPDRWSPLEYGCHVRDVLRIFDERINMLLRFDDPLFENWDQDRTAAEDHYELQEPQTVAGELHEAAETLAADFETVDGPTWQRRGRRSDGASFTVVTIGQYMLHDVVHHLWDVTGERSTSST
jgi:hypothetical protein